MSPTRLQLNAFLKKSKRQDPFALYRPILNNNPDLALDVFEQLKEEQMGFAPSVMALAWHVTEVKNGRRLAPPPRHVVLH